MAASGHAPGTINVLIVYEQMFRESRELVERSKGRVWPGAAAVYRELAQLWHTPYSFSDQQDDIEMPEWDQVWLQMWADEHDKGMVAHPELRFAPSAAAAYKKFRDFLVDALVAGPLPAGKSVNNVVHAAIEAYWKHKDTVLNPGRFEVLSMPSPVVARTIVAQACGGETGNKRAKTGTSVAVIQAYMAQNRV